MEKPTHERPSEVTPAQTVRRLFWAWQATVVVAATGFVFALVPIARNPGFLLMALGSLGVIAQGGFVLTCPRSTLDALREAEASTRYTRLTGQRRFARYPGAVCLLVGLGWLAAAVTGLIGLWPPPAA